MFVGKITYKSFEWILLKFFDLWLTLKVTTQHLELFWQATTRKLYVCPCVQNLAWSSVEPKVSLLMQISKRFLHHAETRIYLKFCVFCFGRGSMSGPHHHRRPSAGSGGSWSFSEAPAHFCVQRGPLHHLLRERLFLQLQHQWKTAGTDGSQRLHQGETATHKIDVS